MMVIWVNLCSGSLLHILNAGTKLKTPKVPATYIKAVTKSFIIEEDSHLLSVMRYVERNALRAKLVKKADGIITSSKTLQKKFGGTWIPSGPNTDYFDPEKYDKKKIRKEFGIEKDDKLLLFCGTPKEHKGVRILVEAFNKLDREDLKSTDGL